MIIGILVEDVGPVSSIEGAVTVLGLVALFPILMAFKIDRNVRNRDQGRAIPSYMNEDGEVGEESELSHDNTNKGRNKYVVYLAILLFIGLGLGIGGIIMQFKLLSEAN